MRRPSIPPARGTLGVVLARTFGMVRATRLERIESLTIEVPDECGNRWQVRITRLKSKKEK